MTAMGGTMIATTLTVHGSSCRVPPASHREPAALGNAHRWQAGAMAASPPGDRPVLRRHDGPARRRSHFPNPARACGGPVNERIGLEGPLLRLPAARPARGRFAREGSAGKPTKSSVIPRWRTSCHRMMTAMRFPPKLPKTSAWAPNPGTTRTRTDFEDWFAPDQQRWNSGKHARHRQDGGDTARHCPAYGVRCQLEEVLTRQADEVFLTSAAASGTASSMTAVATTLTATCRRDQSCAQQLTAPARKHSVRKAPGSHFGQLGNGPLAERGQENEESEGGYQVGKERHRSWW